MTRKENISIGVGLVAVGLGYLGVRSIQRRKLYNKILEKIGGGSGSANYVGFYNPGYWQKDFGVPVIYLSSGAATKKARAIYNSIGLWDDETAYLGVLRSLKDGVALSQVAHKYQGLINRDLREDIEKNYDTDSENKQRHAILNKLAPFRATS